MNVFISNFLPWLKMCESNELYRTEEYQRLIEGVENVFQLSLSKYFFIKVGH